MEALGGEGILKQLESQLHFVRVRLSREERGEERGSCDHTWPPARPQAHVHLHFRELRTKRYDSRGRDRRNGFDGLLATRLGYLLAHWGSEVSKRTAHTAGRGNAGIFTE